MKTILEISLCCVMMLSCSKFAMAQSSTALDPCGDPRLESYTCSVVRGRVVKVVDGDTVIISLKGGKLRRTHLKGIDAPERGQAFSEASRLLLERLVQGKFVEVCVNDEEWIGRPMPAEMAGIIRLQDIGRLDVNLLMIQSGMAQYKEPERYAISNYAECQYAMAEEEARAARRGLWRGAA